jgi:hypothetical protein
MREAANENRAAARSNLRAGNDRRNGWDTFPIVGERRVGQRRQVVSSLERRVLLNKPAPFEVCEYPLSLWRRFKLVVGGLCAQYRRVTWYQVGGKTKAKGWQHCKTGVTFVTFWRREVIVFIPESKDK